MSLIDCDYTYCGAPPYNGMTECAPYCNDPDTDAACPYVGLTDSVPFEVVDPGGSSQIEVVPSIPGSTVYWFPSGDGTLSDPYAAVTQYTCQSSGLKTINVQVTKPGRPDCGVATDHVLVQCD
jgi:hypothetical protein